ncbi:MAG TPA: HigA family addiction module antitoxin [Acidobacteriota bacterium]|nr:HigA family addiction module antitoxin [Acidobacteriota bacterium]
MCHEEKKGLPPTHPGQLLREEILPATNLTQGALAKQLGVSRRTINEIVREKRSVSADMAHRLARLFDTTPEFWLGLQQDVDLWAAQQAREREYARIKPLRKSA